MSLVRKFRAPVWVAVISLVLTLSSLAIAQPLYPDAIYYHGKIVTVDKNFSIAQAFAVYGDKFVAVGTDKDVLAMAGPGTRKIDLQGRTIVPGLIDDHYHFISNAGNDFREIALVDARSKEEFLNIIRTRADQTAPGDPITSQSGWNHDQFGGWLPTKEDLDKVAPRNPVFLSGGHTMYLNSLALKQANITRDTPSPYGGVITKDKTTGEPTGQLIDSASSLVSRLLPRATYKDKIEGLRRAQPLLHSVGLTGVRDPGIGPDDMRIYQELWDNHELTVRVSTNLSLPSNPPAKDIVAELARWGVHTRFGDHVLRLDGIGEFGMDGGFQAALLRDKYAESPTDGEFFGLQKIPADKFTEVMRGINKLGWRACVHAAGDKAVDIVLDAYEAANKDQSIVGKRWTIEHALVTNPDQFERIKRLGVIISSQFHTFMAAETMIENWGKERGEQSSRDRDWLNAGIRTGMGTDWTRMPPNPFEALSFLVTRKNRFGKLIGPEQRITRQEALRLGTIDNAYITFEEDVKGSIEPGKLADFVVLTADYLTVPDDEIKNIKAELTAVSGKVVYERGKMTGKESGK